MPGDHSGLYCY